MLRVVLLPLFLLLLGCAEDVDSYPTVPLNPNRDPTLTYLHAYGDSITYGYLLQDRAVNGFPSLTAHANVLPLTNYASNGEMACDLPTHQIFPNTDSPSLAHRGLYSILISSTETSIYGAGPYEAIFNLCHQASIAWLAIPAEEKTLATSPSVTTSGPTHNEGPPFNALWTDATGASITFPVTLPAAGPVYVWYRIVNYSPGAFSVALDGTVISGATTGTTPILETYNQSSTSLALLRIPGISAGRHTLTFTQTSTITNSAPSGAGILAVGLPPVGAQPAGMPKVMVGTTPKQLQGGTAACAFTQAPCQAYINDITANVNLLRGDNLNVLLFTSGKYMTGTTADIADTGGHPNILGNQEIYHSISDILN